MLLWLRPALQPPVLLAANRSLRQMAAAPALGLGHYAILLLALRRAILTADAAGGGQLPVRALAAAVIMAQVQMWKHARTIAAMASASKNPAGQRILLNSRQRYFASLDIGAQGIKSGFCLLFVC